MPEELPQDYMGPGVYINEQPIIQAGDVVDGAALVRIAQGPHLNDLGDVVFAGAFADGIARLVVVPIPEPGTWWLLMSSILAIVCSPAAQRAGIRGFCWRRLPRPR